MKSSKYSDSAIMAILKQAESGVPVPQLCREHGMSSATFYKWRSKFGGMDARASCKTQPSYRFNCKPRAKKDRCVH